MITEKKIITIEADIECTQCGGTGLYVGMAERGGSAVICYSCEGTGKMHIKHTYTEFNGRNKRDDVKRVYKTGASYCISAEDVTNKEGNHFPFSQVGCSYEDWLSGKEPKPIKFLFCPLLHFQQGTVQGEFLKACHCKATLGMDISKCSKTHHTRCWSEWDEKFAKLSEAEMKRMENESYQKQSEEFNKKYGNK